MSLLKNNARLKAFIDDLGARILKILIKIFSTFDLSLVARFRFVGLMFYYLFPIRKKLLRENLMRSGLFMTENDCEKTIKDIYICQSLNFFEFLWMKNIARAENVHKYFRIHGLNHLAGVIGGREGGIIISAHLGNWEMLASILGRLGVNLTSLVAERDIKLHKCAKEHRLVTPYSQTIDRNHAALKCMRLIKQKKVAGVVSDQHTDNAGVENTFFGIPCRSTSLPAALSLKTGAPIFGVFMIRSHDYITHDIYIEPPVFASDFSDETRDRDAQIKRCTQAITDMIEKRVEKNPEQWFWFHKRWRD